MSSRAVALALAVSSQILAVTIAPVSGSSMAGVPEAGVEFQDGAGNIAQSFSPGQVASFFIKDSRLGTVATSTATWTQISSRVTASTSWSLATGQPRAEAYTLSQGNRYDTTTLVNTLLSAVPTPRVNGVAVLRATFIALTGEITLLNNVNESSTLEVAFVFDVVDLYPADQHRANVTSTSDAEGEWVPINEVVSETNDSAIPTSGLFLDQVAPKRRYRCRGSWQWRCACASGRHPHRYLL